MRYIAAYLLLQLGGNAKPSAEDITKLLGVVGIEADSDRLNKLVAELDGKSTSDLFTEGLSKLASVPSGGGGAGPAPTGVPAALSAVEEKKPEKEEEKEESDDDMGFSLFD